MPPHQPIGATHQPRVKGATHLSAGQSVGATHQSEPKGARHLSFTMLQRMLALGSGVCVLGMLIVASLLQPDASGYGTHQQLGLPPCTSVVILGMRCPACGMTTSWSLLLHGRITEAAGTNLGGMMIAIIALAYLPASCYFTVVGKSTRDGWFSLALGICLLVAVAVSVIQWLGRMII
jgi:Protein of unknown function (DUF2752)